jgi:hypothetical protein
MAQTDHSKHFNAIQERYRCTECDPAGGKFCWVAEYPGFAKPYHARLDWNHINKWATYIVNGTSTIHYPPRIKDFDDIILEPLLKWHFKRKPSDFEGHELSNISQSSGTYAREVHHWHESSHPAKRPRYRYNSPDDTPESSPYKSRKQKSHYNRRDSSVTVNSSPTVDRVNVDIGTLSPFIKWCKDHESSYGKWDNVFTMLRDDDVEMDSFGRKPTTEKVMKLCPQMKRATATRVAKAHSKYLKDGLTQALEAN